MIKLTKSVRQIVQNKTAHHVLFWAFAYFILLNMFSGSSEILSIDHIYTSIFMATLFFATEINLLVLIPRFLTKKRYPLYLVVVVITLFGFTLFNKVLFDKLIDYVLPGYYFISYFSFVDILIFFMVFAVVTTLLKLSKEWFYLNEASQKIVIAEKEKITSELKALRSQLNPHFLFNSLNVVYSLALKKSPKTPRVVLQLSDILRYVIYETNEDFIFLKDEVALINNYLSLQEHRISPSAKIDFETDIVDENIKIPPMILLPLIENSFKHGIKKDFKDVFVRINLTANNGKVVFNIENNKSDVPEGHSESGGIGIQNIKSRLELIYPDRHQFVIKDMQKTFEVNLEIYDICS